MLRSLGIVLVVGVFIGACGEEPQAPRKNPWLTSTGSGTGTNTGGGGAGPGSCADVGVVPMTCDSDDLLWCDSGTEVHRLDCSDIGETGANNGTCSDMPGFLPWCVVEAGAPCAFVDSDDDPVFMACGVDGALSSTMGCDYDDGCISGVSACNATSFTPSCNGSRLALDCADFGGIGQPVTIDCADPGFGGGTCDGNVCRVSGGGSACYPGVIECSPPYGCGANGTCEMTSETFTGVGASVAECQGTGSAAGTLAGQAPIFNSGFGATLEGATNAFLFGRQQITAANFPGTPGEWKMRLLLNSSMGGDQYGGTMFLGQWDAAGERWEGSTTSTAVVTVADFSGVDPTGLMCNGRFIGQAEGLFGANDYVIVTFAVPLLTTAFPSGM